jgi:hypothetical protein
LHGGGPASLSLAQRYNFIFAKAFKLVKIVVNYAFQFVAGRNNRNDLWNFTALRRV